eukprot:gnl/Spiro4/1218_TR643_c0_g1_i1.p1 gnl/Spiro4/1218_TR643_c0_g1~~gnl/Spiro4/1218_TR643_c0_g1_i1.p1  ORF type:complete len:1008 (+),score=334.39 gnl/Spiro4/1218_TR643_c0_g1_i1:114-3026(+)
MEQVERAVRADGMIPAEKVHEEVVWFYSELGIADTFFVHGDVPQLASFIVSIYASKLLHHTSKQKSLSELSLEHVTDHGAIFMCDSTPGSSTGKSANVEAKIESEFLNPHRSNTKRYRVEAYRSEPAAAKEMRLRCFFVEECDFPEGNSTDANETDLAKISSRQFFSRASDHTKGLVSSLMSEVVRRTGCVTRLVESGEDFRLMVATRYHDSQRLFSGLSDIYRNCGLSASQKFVEQFSNDITIYSLFLQKLPQSDIQISGVSDRLISEVSLYNCLPPTSPFVPYFCKKIFSLSEAAYAHVVWVFCQHFLNRVGADYWTLRDILDVNKTSEHAMLLDRIKRKLRSDVYSSNDVFEIIVSSPDLVRALFAQFAAVHRIPRISGQTPAARPAAEMSSLIQRTCMNEHESQVFLLISTFNSHVLKTNFFQFTKVSLAFRLDPAFLSTQEYPQIPFGLFFLCGPEFRGFHLRFCDVARGGVRVIRSANREVFANNVRNMFDENYNLASTQHLKNKDIPEGGSKGTILVNLDCQHLTTVAFQKYVDGLLDLLLTGRTPGIKEPIVDLYGKPELLFLGPDEGTAGFMDWAAEHARGRAAPFWKAFTTGKSPTLGGIPHDTYGMTTQGVHQFVLCILEKMGLKEEDCTKAQTGGPDGDLGSNEIKISRDRYTVVIDGSGVLYDPAGLDRAELVRLAERRQMIKEFNLAKLSPKGFRVLESDRDVTLPDGTVVANGMDFRNQFHLNPLVETTLFVPCGGRPEAVNVSNVARIFKDGQPRFKYIVEGANLFFTQAARLALEREGVVLIKDSSANKGGVTSSSLEVFASLTLSDEQFLQHMCVRGNTAPAFYQSYVADVQQIIQRNARLEFDCLWRERENTKQPLCVISDLLSSRIVRLSQELAAAEPLWNNTTLRQRVLQAYCPPSLLELVGGTHGLAFCPESYLRAIFGAFLASRFVYMHGLDSSFYSFFEFMQQFSR